MQGAQILPVPWCKRQTRREVGAQSLRSSILELAGLPPGSTDTTWLKRDGALARR